MKKNNWRYFLNIDTLSKKLATDVLDYANECIEKNDNFTIVLTGGSSVINLYKILSKSSSNWNKWKVYIGDERCLPIGHKDRNDFQINSVWLDGGQIPKKNINFIGSGINPKISVLEYEKCLKDVEIFDLVLLSMGEDGHAASLFPGHDYKGSKSVVIESNSPKTPKERISMSYDRLNMSRKVYKIIYGKSKKNALNLLCQGKNMPFSKINGLSHEVYICTE